MVLWSSFGRLRREERPWARGFCKTVDKQRTKQEAVISGVGDFGSTFAESLSDLLAAAADHVYLI